MELLNKLKTTRQEIYDYFGYSGEGVYIENAINMFWNANTEYGRTCEVWFSEEERDVTGMYCNNVHMEYKGKDYTMFSVNDSSNQRGDFLQIFDNSKRVEDE